MARSEEVAAGTAARDDAAPGREPTDSLLRAARAGYRALPKYRGEGRLSTWLYRITYNACLRHEARRPKEDGRHSGQAQPLPDHSSSVAERLDLAAALAALPIGQRALVLMVDRDGFDYRAAAEALSIPVGTVSSRLASARARLRRSLSDQGEANDEV